MKRSLRRLGTLPRTAVSVATVRGTENLLTYGRAELGRAELRSACSSSALCLHALYSRSRPASELT